MPILGLYRKGEIEQVVEAALKKAGKSEYAAWLLETAESARFDMPDLEVYENQANLYRQLSWVRIAVNIAARSASSEPLNVYRQRGEKLRDIPNHEFEELLNRPNPLDSRDELLFAIFASLLINGNGYWWLNREDENAKLDEIWFIPPHMIEPVPDERLYLKGYAYYPGGGITIPMEPHEILHLRTFNPLNRFVGLSPIEALATQSVGDLKAQDWNTRLFAENNARLPGILAFKQFINNDDWDRLKQEARSSAAKRDMLMLRGAGDGVNWMQASASQKDMEFLEGRNFTKEEIWAVIAPGLSSMLAVNATEANAVAGSATFNSQTIYPLHRALASKITNVILPAYGLKLVAEFDDVRWQDRQLEIQEIDQYAKYHTLKEVRENKYNDDPLGDERDDKIAGGNLGQGDPTQVQPVTEPPMNPDEQVDDEENQAESTQANEELEKFQRKSLKALERGKSPAVDFFSNVLPVQQVMGLQASLATCKTADQVRAVFGAVTPRTEAAVILEAMRLEVAGIKAAARA